MITMEQYSLLLKYATKLTYRSSIDPYDVVHSAIVLNEDCTKKEINTSYSAIRNERANTVEYADVICKDKIRTRICHICKEDLPMAAFNYRSSGKIRYACDRCIDRKNAQHSKQNADRTKAYYANYHQTNRTKRTKYAKQWKLLNPIKAKEIRKNSNDKRPTKNKKSTTPTVLILDNNWITPSELANELKTSPRIINNWIYRKKINYKVIPGTIYNKYKVDRRTAPTTIGTPRPHRKTAYKQTI